MVSPSKSPTMQSTDSLNIYGANDCLITTNNMSQTDLTLLKIESLEKELEIKKKALDALGTKFQELFNLRNTETEKVYQDYKSIAEERFKFVETSRLELQKENQALKTKLQTSFDMEKANEIAYLNQFYAALTGLSLELSDDGRIHCNYTVELDDADEELEFTLTPCEVVNQNRRESTSRRQTLSMATPYFDYQPIRVPTGMEERMGKDMQFEQSEARWFFKQLIEGLDQI